MTELRPALPLRFMQVLGITAATLGAAGWHTGANEAGAIGGLKQLSFMYSLTFPGLTGFAHPGPVRRSGNGHGSPFMPTGSPPISNVKGAPVDAVKIPPTSQPPRMCCAAAPPNFGAGITQMKFAVKFLVWLKSQ